MERQSLQDETPFVSDVAVAEIQHKSDATTIQAMAPEEFAGLVRQVNQESQDYRKRQRVMGGLTLVLGVLFVSSVSLHWPLRLLLFLVYIGVMLSWAWRPFNKGPAARALAEMDDLSAVGPLIEAMGSTDFRIHHCFYVTLARLLPRLRASDAHLLNDKHLSKLYFYLDYALQSGFSTRLNRARMDLTVGIFEALEQVGDSRAMAHVEKLANFKAKNADHRRIRAAAQECLSALRGRLERGEYTLLRPAAAPDDPAEVLLRPAQGVSDADPQTLLRPVNGAE